MKFKLRDTKIQRIGYSFYASLPIEWVHHNNLGKGSTIKANLDEHGRLILEAEQPRGTT